MIDTSSGTLYDFDGLILYRYPSCSRNMLCAEVLIRLAD